MSNVDAQETVETKPTPAPPRFVGGPPREKTIVLEHPVEYDGTVYETVTVRKMLAREIEDFVEQVRAGGSPSLPMIDIPGVVLDHLSADDFWFVNQAINNFLPRQLRTEE